MRSSRQIITRRCTLLLLGRGAGQLCSKLARNEGGINRGLYTGNQPVAKRIRAQLVVQMVRGRTGSSVKPRETLILAGVKIWELHNGALAIRDPVTAIIMAPPLERTFGVVKGG
jgi:hypothetical protein